MASELVKNSLVILVAERFGCTVAVAELKIQRRLSMLTTGLIEFEEIGDAINELVAEGKLIKVKYYDRSTSQQQTLLLWPGVEVHVSGKCDIYHDGFHYGEVPSSDD